MEEPLYFEIINSNGQAEKMELLARFYLEEFGKNYIFYKNCGDQNLHFYAASYELNDDDDFSNLSVDFSDREKQVLNELFEKLRKGEYENA